MHDPDMTKYNDSLTYHISFHSKIVYFVFCNCWKKRCLLDWLRELTPHCTIKFSFRVNTYKLKQISFKNLLE